MNDQSVTSLKFQLGGPLRKWVEQLSSENGHSLAEEIRQQLGAAYRLDMDRRTRFLIEDIFLLASEVKKEVGERWYENERARAIFVAAVTDHITNVDKKDEPYRKDPSRVDTEEEIIGRTIARLFRRK
jgi:hypothetical protein